MRSKEISDNMKDTKEAKRGQDTYMHRQNPPVVGCDIRVRLAVLYVNRSDMLAM